MLLSLEIAPTLALRKKCVFFKEFNHYTQSQSEAPLMKLYRFIKILQFYHIGFDDGDDCVIL